MEGNYNHGTLHLVKSSRTGAGCLLRSVWLFVYAFTKYYFQPKHRQLCSEIHRELQNLKEPAIRVPAVPHHGLLMCLSND